MIYVFDSKISDVLNKYLKKIGWNISFDLLKSNILMNPNYPGILSITDTLEKLEIEHLALRRSANDLFSEGINAPFLSLMKLPKVGKDFVLITSFDGNQIVYYYGNSFKSIKKEEFVTDFLNIILIANGNESKTEYSLQNLNESLKKYLPAFLIFFTFVIIYFIGQFPFTSGLFLLLAAKFIGLLASYFLISHEINPKNSFVSSICGVDENNHCDKVTKSDGAKFGVFSMAETGFIYFLTTILLLAIFRESLNLLQLFSLASIPIIIYSIYYQKFVVKEWCYFCLVIASILIFENLLFLGLEISTFQLNINYFVVVKYISILLFSTLILYVIKPIVLSHIENEVYKPAYYRIKNNSDIFHSLLKLRPTILPGYENIGFNLGNENSEHQFIEICNAYCEPCSRKHPKLIETIQKLDASLKIIFINQSTEQDLGAIIVKHFIAIEKQFGKDKLKECLEFWHKIEDKNYEKLKAEFPIISEFKETIIEIEKMSLWCYNAQIQHTPTIYYNGHILPDNYTLDELLEIL